MPMSLVVSAQRKALFVGRRSGDEFVKGIGAQDVGDMLKDMQFSLHKF